MKLTLRNSAKGQDCQVRIPSTCNYNPETTVLAHLSEGGIGMKGADLHATFACSACHDAIDGRATNKVYTRNEIGIMANDGMKRTQLHWVNVGLVKVGA